MHKKMVHIGLAGLAAIVPLTGGLAQTAPAAPAPATAADKPVVSMRGVGRYTADLARALRFYRDGLGMVELRRLPAGKLDEVILGFGADPAAPQILLLAPRAGDTAVPVQVGNEANKIVLGVSDAEGLKARLTAAGYAPGAIRENARHGVRVFWVSDPDGNRFELVERFTPTTPAR